METKVQGLVWRNSDFRGEIKPGMIRLGFNQVSIYPNTGIMLQINGKITFHGRCTIGNNSYISTGKDNCLEFGENFMCTTSLKLVSYDHITFGDHVMIGWNCMICDKDLFGLQVF